ncbi:MAG: hypothetical protein Q7R35_12245 [Elusimicrobiota bacterium]|nr:hypothetical protein [Elusimicrobiota bacterium]
MFKTYCFFLAASAVILFSGAARAEGKKPPAPGKPAKQAINAISAELKVSTTAQFKADIPGYTDFDAFSSVNDPLYREGSKELLKQVMENDAGKKGAARDTLRDAPISKELQHGAVRAVKARPFMKKARAGKPLHTDPVKAKNTF